MANRRVLVKRRRAVRNIRKITRTMQLIATARFQAAHNRAVATRPYTQKLAELVSDLARAGGGLEHPLLEAPERPAPGALVVVTSNRGLCGAYNANVLRTALGFLDEHEDPSPALHVFGKKGIAYFRFLRMAMAEQVTTMGDTPRFDRIEPVANALMDRFLKGELSSVHVAYMRFISAGQQRPEIVQLLPLGVEEVEGRAPGARSGRTIEYEFHPEPKALLDELLPAVVRARLFQAFIDAVVSEHVARMVAMKAATESAEEMIRMLGQQYNRARQTQITTELLDIVGGANALQ